VVAETQPQLETFNTETDALVNAKSSLDKMKANLDKIKAAQLA